MKNISILSLLLIFASNIAFAQVDRTQRPKAEEPRKIEIGHYEMFQLENGLKVFVVENHKLPRINVSLILDRDPYYENEKAGMLDIVGPLLRSGTENRTKDQIDEEIDYMGARLNVSSTGVYGGSLKKYQDKLFEVMSDVLLNPSFNPNEFDKIKKQMMSELSNLKDEPDAVNRQVYNALLFGKNNAFGEFASEETVDNVSIEDCKMFYQTYFRPNIGYMAIVGDINLKEAKSLVNKYFSSWEASDVPDYEFTKPQARREPLVALVNRDASVQSVIKIGNTIKLEPGSEDILPLSVATSILGGGSKGRLYLNLREDKGFTYGAYSSFDTDKYISDFFMVGEVRNEVTDSSLTEFMYELNRMKNEPVSSEELKLAKSTAAGSFGRSLENASTVARFAINIDRYNLPADYYETYLKRLEAVTIEDVERVSKKYMGNENFTIVVVGKASEIAEKITSFGELKYYDYQANEVDPPMMPVPDGVTAKSVIDRYITSVGGLKALGKVKSYEMKMEVNMTGAPQPITMIVAKDLKNKYMYQVIKMGATEYEKTTFDGEVAKKSGMRGSEELSGDDILEVKLESGVLVEDVNYFNEGFKTELVGATKESDKVLYVIESTNPVGKTTTEYYDKESGLKHRKVQVEETPQGPFTISIDYVEFKEVRGIKVPSKMIQTVGQQSMDINLIYFDPKKKFNKEYLAN